MKNIQEIITVFNHNDQLCKAGFSINGDFILHGINLLTHKQFFVESETCLSEEIFDEMYGTYFERHLENLSPGDIDIDKLKSKDTLEEYQKIALLIISSYLTQFENVFLGIQSFIDLLKNRFKFNFKQLDLEDLEKEAQNDFHEYLNEHILNIQEEIIKKNPQIDFFDTHDYRIDSIENLALINDIINLHTEKKLNTPCIIIFKGDKRVGKTSLINSIIKDKNVIYFTDSPDDIEHFNSILDGFNSFPLFCCPDIFHWDHIDFEEVDTTFILNKLRNINIFEFEKTVPQSLEKMASVIIDVKGVSSSFLEKELEDSFTSKDIFLSLTEKKIIFEKISKEHIDFNSIKPFIRKILIEKKLNREICFDHKEKKLFELDDSEERIFNIKEAKKTFQDCNSYCSTSDSEEILPFSKLFSSGKTDEKENILALFETYNKPVKNLIVDDNFLEKLTHILDCFPNIEQGKNILLSYAKTSFFLHKKTTPFKFDNILLIGDPGCGKTFFAKQLASLFNHDPYIISLGSGMTPSDLFGIQQCFYGSRESILLKSFYKNSSEIYSNSVVVFDEIDKIFREAPSQHGDFRSGLCEIFEPITAKNLYDNFFQIHFDYSHVTKIATANSLEDIPNYILNRFPIKIFMRNYSSSEIENTVIPVKYKEFYNKCNTEFLPKQLKQKTCQQINKIAESSTRNLEKALVTYASETREKNNYHTMEMDTKKFESFLKNFHTYENIDLKQYIL